MRRTAATGTALGGMVVVGDRVAPRYSPIGRVAAIAPAFVIGGIAAAAGVHYVTKKAVDHFTGDDRDYSGYTGADALLNEIEKGATDMESADVRVMTSIENNITNSENVAYAKGKAAIIEEMNAGNGESAATDAMQTAIDDYYSTIEKNIITHSDAQMRQLKHLWEQAATHSNVNASNHFTGQGSGGQLVESGWGGTWETRTYTCLNGTTVEYMSYNGETSGSDGMEMWVEKANEGSHGNHLQIDGPNTSAKFHAKTWWGSPLDTVISKRDQVNADLSGFTSDVYANYEPGDIPTEDLVDPITAATELDQNYDNAAGQSAHAAMLGIPTTAELSAELEIESTEAEDGVWEVTADIFTAHTPTDADGNEIGFETGKTYEPSTWNEPFYIAYNYVDEISGERKGAFTSIESPTTFVKVTDADGNDIDTFQTQSRNNQTADIAALEEELQALRKEWIKMQEEAQEETEEEDDDGFNLGLPTFFGGDGGQLLGLGLIGVVVIAVVGIVTDAIPGLGN